MGRFLHAFAGHGVESTRIESCGADIEDVLVDELEGPIDNPGSTTGTSFSVLQSHFPAVFRCGF